MIGIYKITNPKGKIYIGQSKHINQRFKKYKSFNCKGQIKLYNSLVKYTYENHIFEIIEECLFEELNEKERYWQEFYDVCGENGLNLEFTKTDVLKKEFSKETLLKMSESHKGKTPSVESRKKMSENSAKIYKDKTLSEEHKLKLSLAKKGRNGILSPRYGEKCSNESKAKMSNAHGRRVINTNTGEIYRSVKEAAKCNGFTYPQLWNRLKRKDDIHIEYYELKINEREIMILDLNSSEFNRPTVSIFNNGIAGRVNDVAISVERVHKLDMADKNPDYQVIFTDEIGSINLGIYYPGDDSTDSKNKILAQKCTDLVKAVAGDNYIFPAYNSYKEMVDSCMKIIAENSKGKLVNVIATYGTVGFPKKFLGIYKNFNFVEAAGTAPTRLKISKNPNKPEYDDLFERVVEDAPLFESRPVSDTVAQKSPWGV